MVIVFVNMRSSEGGIKIVCMSYGVCLCSILEVCWKLWLRWLDILFMIGR